MDTRTARPASLQRRTRRFGRPARHRWTQRTQTQAAIHGKDRYQPRKLQLHRPLWKRAHKNAGYRNSEKVRSWQLWASWVLRDAWYVWDSYSLQLTVSSPDQQTCTWIWKQTSRISWAPNQPSSILRPFPPHLLSSPRFANVVTLLLQTGASTSPFRRVSKYRAQPSGGSTTMTSAASKKSS